MVIPRRTLLLGGAGLAAVGLAYFLLRGGSPPPALEATGTARAGGRPESDASLPRVALERVDQAVTRPALSAKRDVFAFGGPDPRQQAAMAAQAPPPPPLEPTPTPVPTPTPLPPLNVKYIGSLESKPGLKVAFFMTEKKEVLSGQAGETVMNRFRVVKIGIESVDVQQVGADQVQRLPLKGN